METVVLDKFLVIASVSIITLFLGIISYFLKESHGDLKKILENHEKRIQDVEKHKERTEERHINRESTIEEIKQKLDLIYKMNSGI